MHVIAVLDIRGGVVVRGVGGRRSEYRPLVSQLTTATDPLGVARAVRDRYGLSELYLADLDAIDGAEPRWDEYRRLRANGFRLWVDAGARTRRDVSRFGGHVDRVVAGSETLAELPSPDLTDGTVFSQDLRDGRPLGRYSAADAIAAGIRRVIVIDLARVGVGCGVGTEAFVGRFGRQNPGVEIYVGGGVRDREDIVRLERIGVTGVLVASMLHRTDTKL